MHDGGGSEKRSSRYKIRLEKWMKNVRGRHMYRS